MEVTTRASGGVTESETGIMFEFINLARGTYGESALQTSRHAFYRRPVMRCTNMLVNCRSASTMALFDKRGLAIR